MHPLGPFSDVRLSDYDFFLPGVVPRYHPLARGHPGKSLVKPLTWRQSQKEKAFVDMDVQPDIDKFMTFLSHANKLLLVLAAFRVGYVLADAKLYCQLYCFISVQVMCWRMQNFTVIFIVCFLSAVVATLCNVLAGSPQYQLYLQLLFL